MDLYSFFIKTTSRLTKRHHIDHLRSPQGARWSTNFTYYRGREADEGSITFGEPFCKRFVPRARVELATRRFLSERRLLSKSLQLSATAARSTTELPRDHLLGNEPRRGPQHGNAHQCFGGDLPRDRSLGAKLNEAPLTLSCPV